jgi:phosphate:Na+ symporter
MILSVLELLGSLGMFLFGMKIMSESLQKLSGEKLRGIMHAMTGNRFSGLATGFSVTCMVQSSSASTVMVVSFVNAGLLTLSGAIAMILGANLGTTTTFWIVSLFGFKFSISAITLPMIGVALPLIFAKNPKCRNSGEFLIGVGLLFMGLDFLKEAVPDVQSNPEAFEFINQFTGHDFGSLLAFIVFGTLLTVMVQSSSVAGAITITMAANGWIDYPSACAIILGENIGTTITANLAAIGGNVNAKRAARAHLIFNLIGVAWAILLFVPMSKLTLLMVGSPQDSVTGFLQNPRGDLPVLMATFHTTFNLLNILLVIGFVKGLERLVVRLVKEPDDPGGLEPHKSPHMTYESALLPQIGELNIAAAERDVDRMGALTKKLLIIFADVFEKGGDDLAEVVLEAKRLEQESDILSFETTAYLLRCSSSGLSQSSIDRITAILRVLAELEEVCDCGYRLVMLAERKHRKNRVLPDETTGQVREFAKIVLQFMEFYSSRLRGTVEARDMETAYQLENFIDSFRKSLRKESMHRIKNSGENVKAEMLYIDILNNMESIGNHAINVLQALRHAED